MRKQFLLLIIVLIFSVTFALNINSANDEKSAPGERNPATLNENPSDLATSAVPSSKIQTTTPPFNDRDLDLRSSISYSKPADGGIWEPVDKTRLRQPGIDEPKLPNSFETFRLNKPALKELLNRAPEENSGGKPVILRAFLSRITSRNF